MPALFKNSATATLAGSITSTATSIAVAGGFGSLFPSLSGSQFFYATLVNSSNQVEVVKVTARSGDVMTVVRGQDGTTARAYSSGDKFELRVVAAVLENFAQLDGANTFSGSNTFSQVINGSISGNAATVTNGVYNNGATYGISISGNAATATTATNATSATSATNATNATNSTNATKLATTNFTIEQSGSSLVFKNGATVIASLSSTGVFTTISDMVAGGTL